MKSAMRSRLAIILLVLTACSTTTDNIDDATEWAQATERTDRSIVFGRIRWIENGEEKEIGDSYFKMGLRPDLIRMEDKQRIQASVDNGGHFVWSLEPGTYLMHRIVYWDTWSGSTVIVPKVAFSVPKAGQIYYLGTLRSDFTKKRDLIGGVGGSLQFSVQSERYEEEARLRKECGLETRAVTSNLMRHDERLPTSVETSSAFLAATRVITAMAITGAGTN